MSDEATKLKAEEQAFWDAAAISAMAALIPLEDEAMRAEKSDGERTGFDDNPWPDGDATHASRLADDARIIADALLTARRERGQQ